MPKPIHTASLAFTSLWALSLLSCDQPPPPAQAAASCHPSREAAANILVYTRTTGYRHGSIETGVTAIQQLGAGLGFVAKHTEDPAEFTDEGLAGFGAVVFLSTTQDVLDEGQQAALERFVNDGGGFVGVHAAADTEYEWPWYGQLVGAWFKSHPAIQEAVLTREDSTHPSTRCVPLRWTRTDEWYDFRSLPPADATVHLSIDESSYEGGTMGATHPMSWSRQMGEGRSWYTALGHTRESYGEPAFLDHLAGGILWVLGGGAR